MDMTQRSCHTNKHVFAKSAGAALLLGGSQLSFQVVARCKIGATKIKPSNWIVQGHPPATRGRLISDWIGFPNFLFD